MQIGDTCFDRFIDSLSALLGEGFEIIVMDTTKGYEHSIVKVINGISGRTVGDTPSSVFFENLPGQNRDHKESDVYFHTLPDGRILKTMGMFLRNDAEEITGAINISMDVTEMIRVSNTLSSFLGDHKASTRTEFYSHTLDELMDHYLTQVEASAEKPARQMSKAEKLTALKFLDSKGVLHMSKSSVRLCEFFGFSKYTLYTYLDEIRRQ